MQLTKQQIKSLEEILSHIEGDEIESYEECFGEGSATDKLEDLSKDHIYYHITVLREALEKHGRN